MSAQDMGIPLQQENIITNQTQTGLCGGHKLDARLRKEKKVHWELKCSKMASIQLNLL
jgi:hypothetical protein